MADPPSLRRWLSGPDRLGLQLDGALTRLEADSERGLGSEALGQVYTGAPFARIPRPPHPDVTGRGITGLVQDWEHDHVPVELALLEAIRHGHAPDRACG